MKKLILLLLFISLVSCQVEPSEPYEENFNDNNLVKSIKIEDLDMEKETIINFEYENSKIKKIKRPYYIYESNILVHESEREFIYEYNGGLISKVEVKTGDILDLSIELDYLNNLISNYKSKSYQGYNTYYREGFSSTFQNSLKSEVRYKVIWSDSNLSNNWKFEYPPNQSGETAIEQFFDSNRNLIEERMFVSINNGPFDLWTTEKYNYDERNNPHTNINGFKETIATQLYFTPDFLISNNNVISVTKKWEVSGQNIAENYNYQYNLNGFPSIVTHSFNGSTRWIYTLYY